MYACVVLMFLTNYKFSICVCNKYLCMYVGNSNMVGNGCKTNKSRPAAAVKVIATTTKTATSTSTSVFAKYAKPLPTKPTRTTSTTATCGMPHLSERYWRSSSLPNIWLSSHG